MHQKTISELERELVELIRAGDSERSFEEVMRTIRIAEADRVSSERRKAPRWIVADKITKAEIASRTSAKCK